MYLAEEMRKKAQNVLDEDVYMEFRDFALKQIERHACAGMYETEIFLDYWYGASFPEAIKGIKEKEVYWDALAEDLMLDGFRVKKVHYLGPGRYGYALDVSWK